MNIIIGFVITIGCIIGSFMAMGGHLEALFQPFELVIIGGAGLGSFIMGNPMFAQVSIDSVIPSVFYKAVAELIHRVYAAQAKNKRVR